MTTLAQVPVGIGPPCQLTGTITPQSTSALLDMTQVTAISLLVKRSDGSVVTWTASIIGQTTTGLLNYAHNFAVGDCTVIGVYMVAPQLTTSGGTVPCYARPLIVTDSFGT